MLGYTDGAVNWFFVKALCAIGEDWGMEELLPVVMEVGQQNYACMELLDKANTETYGNPEITSVDIGVRSNPGILISGHDLRFPDIDSRTYSGSYKISSSMFLYGLSIDFTGIL